MLHDFENGTMRWLESRLSKLKSPKQIVLLQHHPFGGTDKQLKEIHGFTLEKQKRIESLLVKYFPEDIYSAMFTGGHYGRSNPRILANTPRFGEFSIRSVKKTQNV
jgi:hypothetical protein